MRAQRFSADMFFVNELADRLRIQDPQPFKKSFARRLSENSLIKQVAWMRRSGIRNSCAEVPGLFAIVTKRPDQVQ